MFGSTIGLEQPDSTSPDLEEIASSRPLFCILRLLNLSGAFSISPICLVPDISISACSSFQRQHVHSRILLLSAIISETELTHRRTSSLYKPAVLAGNPSEHPQLRHTCQTRLFFSKIGEGHFQDSGINTLTGSRSLGERGQLVLECQCPEQFIGVESLRPHLRYFDKERLYWPPTLIPTEQQEETCRSGRHPFFLTNYLACAEPCRTGSSNT